MRNVRRLARAGLAAALLATAACSYTLDATGLGVPATLAERGSAQPQGTPFSVTRHPIYLLWGAFAAGSINLEDALAGQVTPGTSLANVRVRVRSTIFDVLVSAITIGLIAPRTVTIEGVVVQR
jgi:protein-S-isoprenylcysteine O-methyltransferase Ste14